MAWWHLEWAYFYREYYVVISICTRMLRPYFATGGNLHHWNLKWVPQGCRIFEWIAIQGFLEYAHWFSHLNISVQNHQYGFSDSDMKGARRGVGMMAFLSRWMLVFSTLIYIYWNCVLLETDGACIGSQQNISCQIFKLPEKQCC